MQKWASAKVVIPSLLFGIDDPYFNNTTFSKEISGLETLYSAIENYENKLEIDALKHLKSEILLYKKEFTKTNNALEATALKSYVSNVKAALDGATKTPTIDQFTQFEFDVYSNYQLPSLTYARPEDIDSGEISQELSSISDFIATQTGLYQTKSFEEFESGIDELIENRQAALFKDTNFYLDQVAIDSSVISKCHIKNRFKKKNAFVLKLYPRTNTSYSILLAVNFGYDCAILEEVSTTVDVPSNMTLTSRKGVSSNGILSLDLTDNATIALGSAQSVNVSFSLKMNNGLELTLATTALSIGQELTGILSETSFSNNEPDLHIPSGFGITRLGISDYRRVEQTLCCYVAGEVSHIENVMAREYKERSTRRLRRQEDSTTTSSSTESEQLTDTTSTSRFDIQKEINSVISENKNNNLSFGFNTNTSGGKKIPTVGEVSFSLGSNMSNSFSTTNSKEDSISEAVNISKDITEKALNRVVSKISSERVNKIIEEFEEKNQHGFDNRKGAEHISGVFRWVDKVYKNQIHNYGKRLQYEFMIPEPAEFHLLSKASQAASVGSVPLVMPLDPRTNAFGVLEPIRNSAHILESNYHQWAAAYGAIVVPPPKTYLTLGATLNRPDDGSPWNAGKTVKSEIIIPDGYSVETVFVGLGASGEIGWNYIDVCAAGVCKRYYEDYIDKWLFIDSYGFPDLKYMHGSMPISAHFLGHQSGTVTYTVRLARKWEPMKEWQLDTFNAIMSAYEAKLSEYESKKAELETRQDLIRAENPAYYRQIENIVLKKNCISYLTGFGYLGQDFTTGSNVSNHQIMQTLQMDKYAASVKFFEQAFEWNLMSYNFYPFYWGNKARWQELYTIQNEDALFKAFLSSGMARVIITVRPGFERAVMNYMATGLIWDGGEPPILDDPMFLSILDELANPEYDIEETWETRVPSTLTVIQAQTIALEADGLPCYCDDGNPPTEQIVVPEVNPLTGLDVFIEGDTPA